MTASASAKWALTMMSEPLTLADIEAAAARLHGQIVATPCLKSETLSALTGAPIWLKFENLQFTAAFKERGALNRLLQLAPEERGRGVIAMSAGNHAQGVAYHASRLGIAATIVMPRHTPFAKVAQTQAHGARVVLDGDGLAEAGARAREIAAAEGLVFVHPYDHPAIIAGQGTIALEMLRAVPGLQTLVVAIGGGGLAAGMAVAAKAIKPQIRIIGVEVAGYQSLHSRLTGVTGPEGGPGGRTTIAEGIAVRQVGDLPYALLKDRIDEVIVVGEDEIERAIALLAEIEKTVVEGAGAAGLAAVLAHPEKFAGRKTGLVLCGGNIDTRLLAGVLLRQLVRDGRIVRLDLDIADRPGVLADVAARIAAAGGNIIEVEHQRLFNADSAKSAHLTLVVEARDRAHGETLRAAVGGVG